MAKIAAIKGMSDLLPPESESWNRVERLARRLFHTFGFREVRTPVVEPTQLFVRSVGESSAIVEKEMYTFEDRKGGSLTLRPEGTAPVVRAYIESGMAAKDPIAKLCYFGPMFRYEQPQKGRSRQFYQIGAELLGADAPSADAELLLMLHTFFEKLGIHDCRLEINSLGCDACRPGYLEKITTFLKNKGGPLCDECQKRIKKNPLRALDCKKEPCKALTSDAPLISDSWCEACHKHYRAVLGLLLAAGVRTQENPRIVRGLDYYCRTTFEMLCDRLGSQNAVAAGGRYDGLVRDLGGPPAPGIGFAIGMERLMLLAPKIAEIKPEKTIFFALLGEEATRKAMPVMTELRNKGLKIEMAYSGSLKSQMRRADKLKAGQVVILGDEEVAKGIAILKNMETGEQKEVFLNRLSELTE